MRRATLSRGRRTVEVVLAAPWARVGDVLSVTGLRGLWVVETLEELDQ